ncbi:MAG: acyl-CoA mutase large subunit family protein [Burkholderiales bacterium]|nr:acyl-CoA mutase large subunit family protein [Burkholderiales bacterium]
MGLQSRSGIPLKPFYTAQDAAMPAPELPGVFPFTRGRARPAQAAQGAEGWIHRELSGEGDPRHSNAQLKYLIGIGQTGIDVIGDSPTQSMLDADHPLVEHSVGTQGVSLCTREDYLQLFHEIPIEQISVSSSVPSIFALTGLLGVVEANGLSRERVRGSVLQPPLYATDAAYANGMPVALQSRLSVDVMEFCALHLPRFHSYVEDTYFYSESGLDAVEEMALGFVQIRHLVGALLARGVPVDSFAPRIAILVNCSMDLFEEIAKIRATRRIFARMMKEEFGATDPRSLSVVITSHTSGLTLTAQQPVNNVVRGAVQGLALALAGVQAMEISAFDEGYRTPSAEAHLVGLRTQQVLALETGITRVADPLGGSYYVEALTDEIEARILARVRQVEQAGDPIALAENGYFRRIFHDAALRHHREVSTGARPVVGVNCHTLPAGEDRLLRDIAERKVAPFRQRIEAMREHRVARSAGDTRRALREVHAQARAPGINLVPAVHAAFGAGATMGEIAGALRLAYDAPYDPHGALRPDF